MKKQNLKTVYFIWKNGLLKKRDGEAIKTYHEVMRQVLLKIDFIRKDGKVLVDVDKLKNKGFTKTKK